MNVTVFLDFDGVLHPERPNAPRFTQLPLLEGVLRRFPDVAMVLSTTWRLKYPLDFLVTRFAEDIKPRIVDVTPIRPPLFELPAQLWSFSRQAEIVAWMSKHRPGGNWLALDDGVHLFMPFCQNLLLIDPHTGFTETDAIRLADKLLAMGEQPSQS